MTDDEKHECNGIAPVRDSDDTDWARYQKAVARLNATIDPAWSPSDRGLDAVRERAERRLDRLRGFLTYLGNPHGSFPVVHVGGTSGKGSTSTAIATILDAAGYRVGLHTSPYLQVASEKLQIGERLIAAGAFAELVDDVITASIAWMSQRRDPTRLTYGELWMALVATWFARESVDIGVIEVGAGGRYDLTNVVQPAISVITSVGLDHQATLGPTLADIAWHKAGIIKAGAPVVTAVSDTIALNQIVREAAAVGVPVVQVRPDTTDYRIANGPSTPGSPIQTNAAVAVAVIRVLGERGMQIPVDTIPLGLSRTRVPARFELMPRRDSVNILIDGAHNVDKIRALVTELKRLLPTAKESSPVVLFGALDSKDVQSMLRWLVPETRGFVATTAPVYGKSSLPAEQLTDTARRLGATGDIIAEPDSSVALCLARDLANRQGSPLLVTGSLYLAGAVRGWWYPDSAVLEQRTSWPKNPSTFAQPIGTT